MLTIRISQAGACPRRLQLEAWGVEGLPPWEGSERAYEEGRIHEPSILEWASQHLPDAPYYIHSQQDEIWASDRIVGHIDGIGVALEKRAIYLFEAKCLARRGFQEFREKGVREAHPQYYTQVQLYLHGLRRKGLPISQAYIIARNKETPRNRLWDHHYELIEYDQCFAASEIRCLELLIEAIENKVDVDPPYNPQNDWQCRPPWCSYSKYCWPDWGKLNDAVIDRSDLLSTVETLQELNEEIKALEAFRDEVKQKLLQEVSGTARVGSWIVKVEECRREQFDTKLARQELLPDVLSKLVKVVTYRQLKIDEIKEA